MEEIKSLMSTLTEEAKATDTPEVPTDTPIPSDTPISSQTPTLPPPEGMVYVPDFIGMTWDEVSKIFKELGPGSNRRDQ